MDQVGEKLFARGTAKKHFNEKTRFKTKSPDYIWNGKMWDLKTLQTVKAIDSALRHGVKQIKNNPGGILLNFSDIDLDLSDIASLILNRLRRSAFRHGRDNSAILNIKRCVSFQGKK